MRAEVRRTMVHGQPGGSGEAAVLRRLSALDRWLPLWIGVAMGTGILLGRYVPSLSSALERVKITTVSLPIALGLLLMMYPVLAKVRYGRMGRVVADRRTVMLSLVLNWVIGPALMFTLAWILLPDLPAYRTGLIIVGLGRCIAMVLIWNDLACGDNEMAAMLVAVNSLFQIVAYSLLGYFYLHLLPRWLSLEQHAFHVSLWEIARSVLIFLGLPMAAGFLTRLYGVRRKGEAWYEQRFVPKIGPVALWGLLFTVVVLFALQGRAITSRPVDVVRIAAPLLAYFGLMWAISFAIGWRLRLSYRSNTTMAFTAASNNFELAIAVAIGVFGATSGEALAGVVGPLIEVPVLVGLVYVALWLRRRLYSMPGARRGGTAVGFEPAQLEHLSGGGNQSARHAARSHGGLGSHFGVHR
jgi:arsenite transporter